MWPSTRLQTAVNIEHPIIQAPMAGAGGLDMAVAVSEAGGLGSLACAMLDAGGLRDILTAAARKMQGPLNVNFFAHAAAGSGATADAAWLSRLSHHYENLGARPPEQLSPGLILPFDEARCAVIEETRPAVVSFHFGLPGPDILRRVKQAGAKIMSSATTVEEARWLADHGCDIIIAQGYEAGGHRGMFLTEDTHTQLGTLALVPQIADAVDLPVVAAGGIADGRGIAAAFALGACGVQIGTAYLLTEESTINPIYREALHSSKAQPTALTNVLSGRPTRCLVNSFMLEHGPLSDIAPSFPKGFSAIGPLRAHAEGQGSREFSAHYCGQGAVLEHANSAAQLTRDLVAEAGCRIKWMAGVADS